MRDTAVAVTLSHFETAGDRHIRRHPSQSITSLARPRREIQQIDPYESAFSPTYTGQDEPDNGIKQEVGIQPQLQIHCVYVKTPLGTPPTPPFKTHLSII